MQENERAKQDQEEGRKQDQESGRTRDQDGDPKQDEDGNRTPLAPLSEGDKSEYHELSGSECSSQIYTKSHEVPNLMSQTEVQKQPISARIGDQVRGRLAAARAAASRGK